MNGFKLNPNIKKKIRRALEEGLNDAGEVLKDKVKSNAPVDSGKLRQSVKKNDIGDLKIRVEVDVDYAPIVEFGSFKRGPSPFFRPAIKSSKKKMIKRFKDKL